MVGFGEWGGAAPELLTVLGKSQQRGCRGGGQVGRGDVDGDDSGGDDDDDHKDNHLNPPGDVLDAVRRSQVKDTPSDGMGGRSNCRLDKVFIELLIFINILHNNVSSSLISYGVSRLQTS